MLLPTNHLALDALAAEDSGTGLGSSRYHRSNSDEFVQAQPLSLLDSPRAAQEE